MAKILNIQDTQIRNLKPRDKVYSVSYGGGFYVFVQPTGKKVCRYVYQRDGQRKRFHLGDYGRGKNELSLKDILDIYRDKCGKGADPLGDLQAEQEKASAEKEEVETKQREQNEKKRREDARLRLDDAAALFLDKFAGLRNRKPSERTMAEYRNHLYNHIVPKFGEHPLDELPVESIMVWLGNQRPVMANRLFATLSVLCTWSVKNKLMAVNPFVGRDKPGGREESRIRALDYSAKHDEVVNEGELKKFWKGLKDMNPIQRIAFQIALMTGQRIGEILNAQWDDFIDDRWIIPNTKNRKGPHKLPMTADMKALLAELRSVGVFTDYLFPTTFYDKRTKGIRLVRDEKTDKINPMKSPTLTHWLRKALNDDKSSLHGMNSFTTHDLRRTMATHLKALGYNKPAIGLLLNHSDESITDIYARGDDLLTKQQLLEAWQEYLKAVVGGKLPRVLIRESEKERASK